jgi:hypothetical protein
MVTEPPGGPLVLRHASKRKSGTWGPDDYDVIEDGRDIGRIFKPWAGVPPEHPWMWTIAGQCCASLDDADSKFAETRVVTVRPPRCANAQQTPQMRECAVVICTAVRQSSVDVPVVDRAGAEAGRSGGNGTAPVTF